MPRAPNISRQTRAVLAALLAHPTAWRYGYDIARETGLKSGTLYPLLMRLADQGLLESEWRPSLKPGRPLRHAYRLSRHGEELARAQATDVPAAARRGPPREADA